MIHEKWFTSDTHFFHENIIKFCNRPFLSAADMNKTLIHNWNKVVGPNDFVYHLGDVFIGGTEEERCEVLYALNGRKRLIIGNHDESLMKQKGLMVFEKISLWKGFRNEGFTCSHIPQELKRLRDGSCNAHGHTHTDIEEDKHYINVCVDVRNFTPVHMDQILIEVREAVRSDEKVSQWT
jgi:calcineurin-like phosphoesterase family protein